MKREKFDKDLYKNLSTQSLIIFSINSVIEKKGKCTFEELLKECFGLFRDSFCFKNISKWPDSRKLDRPLRSLRKRKLIRGNPKTFFVLTKKGKKMAEDIRKIFNQGRLNL